MNDLLNACLPAFKATLLRRVNEGSLEPVCSGALLISGIGAESVIANGQELRRQHEGGHLLAGIFCPRHAFDWTGYQPLTAAVGDVLLLRSRDGELLAYEVRAAGPGADPTVKGTLDHDAVIAELRRDVGPLEPPSGPLHPVLSTLLH